MPAKSEVLNSWKEIAAYMGRGVRTVQRWEHDLQLPVHRPKGRDRSAVLAFPNELDYWLQQTPVRAHEDHAARPAPAAQRSEEFRVQGRTVHAELAQRSRELRDQARVLRQGLQQAAQSQLERREKLSTTLRKVMTLAEGEPRKTPAA